MVTGQAGKTRSRARREEVGIGDGHTRSSPSDARASHSELANRISPSRSTTGSEVSDTDMMEA